MKNHITTRYLLSNAIAVLLLMISVSCGENIAKAKKQEISKGNVLNLGLPTHNENTGLITTNDSDDDDKIPYEEQTEEPVLEEDNNEQKETDEKDENKESFFSKNIGSRLDNLRKETEKTFKSVVSLFKKGDEEDDSETEEIINEQKEDLIQQDNKTDENENNKPPSLTKRALNTLLNLFPNIKKEDGTKNNKNKNEQKEDLIQQENNTDENKEPSTLTKIGKTVLNLLKRGKTNPENNKNKNEEKEDSLQQENKTVENEENKNSSSINNFGRKLKSTIKSGLSVFKKENGTKNNNNIEPPKEVNNNNKSKDDRPLNKFKKKFSERMKKIDKLWMKKITMPKFFKRKNNNKQDDEESVLPAPSKDMPFDKLDSTHKIEIPDDE